MNQETEDIIPIDLDSSLVELLAQKVAINNAIDEKRRLQVSLIIKQIQAAVIAYNIPVITIIEALGGIPDEKKESTSIPKYRDPVSLQTWTGRGRAPTWIKGKNYEDFLIDRPNESFTVESSSNILAN